MPDVASMAERLAAREREIAAVILKDGAPSAANVAACKKHFPDAFALDPECVAIREAMEVDDGKTKA